MTKYKTEKRKARVGERILITNSEYTGDGFKNDDVLTVSDSQVSGVQTEGGWMIWHREYEVIVGEHTPAPNLDEMSCDELIALVEDAMKALRIRQLQGHFDAQMKAVGKMTADKSDQQKRDDVVEKAKKDVRGLLVGDYGTTTEFIVNAEKRTVVALRKWIVRGCIRERGISKCAPNDCFNAHIGKAIALRRALGLEVPSEYLNVPQPTDVRDGDYVKHYTETERRVVSRAGKFPPINKPFVGLSVVEDHSSAFKIVDDSRAGEGE